MAGLCVLRLINGRDSAIDYVGTRSEEAHQFSMLSGNLRKLISLVPIAIAVLAVACNSTEPAPAPAPAPAATAALPAAPTLPPAPPPPPAAPSSGPKQYNAPPPVTIDTTKDYSAVFVLEKGEEIVVDLFEKRAPITVNNFVFLAREGYYDDITFHRVLPNFMAQSGDPTGTGSGDPGYRFDNEFHSELRHTGPGILSMANAGERNGSGTNGGQFFITFVETSFLDGLNPDGSPKSCSTPRVSCHSVFGEVTEGLDVALGLTIRNPQENPGFLGDKITTIRIEEN